MTSGELPKIRYAVVGLGHIAQKAVLPAFANTAYSQLTALVSGSVDKLHGVSQDYDVKHCWHYDDFDRCLSSGKVDAIFIALPNTLHREYAIRALNKGIHVLCEKPLEMTTHACQEMIDAADANNCKLMTAYRLYFEEANLLSQAMLQEKKIGEPRFFTSIFCYQVKPDNCRTIAKLGGGPLFDIGVYCVNAARNLFQDEPTEVMAMMESGEDDERFSEVEEMFSVTMRFPRNRLAQFICSLGAAPVVRYQVVGSKGNLILEDAYGYSMDKVQKVSVDGAETETETFEKTDQFAAQIDYFSACILADKQPKPSGLEGLKDVRIMEAIAESAEKGRAVKITPYVKSETVEKTG
ncbi:MAG: Gfo/Idh/MocA family oxidoreductase [Candidatus Obscuribacterales bacterium]